MLTCDYVRFPRHAVTFVDTKELQMYGLVEPGGGGSEFHEQEESRSRCWCVNTFVSLVMLQLSST